MRKRIFTATNKHETQSNLHSQPGTAVKLAMNPQFQEWRRHMAFSRVDVVRYIFEFMARKSFLVCILSFMTEDLSSLQFLLFTA